MLKEPAHDGYNINNSKSMEPELGDVSSLKLNDLFTKVGKEKEKLNGSEDDQPLVCKTLISALILFCLP